MANNSSEDRDEYLADNIFWVPPEARWPYLQKNAKRPEIGTLVDDDRAAIERDNKVLKGVLPKDGASGFSGAYSVDEWCC